MSDNPKSDFGRTDENTPVTAINDSLIVSAPIIIQENKTFSKSETIEIKSSTPDCNFFYTDDGSEPDSKSKFYSVPVTIDKSMIFKAIAYTKHSKSLVTSADFFKIPEKRSIKIKSKVNPAYTAGGPEALIDGLRGNINFRLGSWQGYQGTDFEAVVDLGKVQQFHKISAGFLQDAGSWIFMPKDVEFAFSIDNVNFEVIRNVKNDIPDKETLPVIKDFSVDTFKEARYIRIKAKNYGKLPEWHDGFGGDAYIFIDEIIVE